MRYAELHCKTNFSFLEGASHPEELVLRAAELGYEALAITDRASLAGVVRAHTAAKEVGLKLLIGAELHPVDAPPVVLWATDRPAYGRLARLLTIGRRRAPKGECELTLDDIAAHAEGMIVGILARGQRSEVGGQWSIRDIFPDRCYLLASLHLGPDDERKLAQLVALSRKTHIPLAAAGDVHYHVARRKVLHDVLVAIRHGTTVDAAGDLLQPNAQRHLKPIEQIAQLFAAATRHPAGYPLGAAAGGPPLGEDAIRRTLEIADRCTFSLDELRYEYPSELLDPAAADDPSWLPPPAYIPPSSLPSPRMGEGSGVGVTELPDGTSTTSERSSGKRPAPRATSSGAPITPSLTLPHLGGENVEKGERPMLALLTTLTRRGAAARYPSGVPKKTRQKIEHELTLIADLRYEAYFLTVWDIVRYARSQGILCQGRGSAANSAVCYCLGVTSVDPAEMDLLFERFVSRERDEAPDIDVDFEHERREEVLQYLYDKYGRDRCGMTAEVISYRPRSAVRDVGKALGLSLDRVDRLAKNLEGYSREPRLAERCRASGIDPDSATGRRLCTVVEEIVGFPRHLSQHVGGMVITEGPLCELVPIENAAMDDRTVIQWNKDDLDDLGILKVDCLALGMLTAIRKCFDLVKRSGIGGQGSEVSSQRSVVRCKDAADHGLLTTDNSSDLRPPTSDLSLSSIPPGDKVVYEMISNADTIGVFQIESRAQMSMLPRLKPQCFYDLVIEVAIVRPGPIQGDMVHPYLRRRSGEEKVTYPNEAIRQVLHKTLGVPLFQEQAMRLAVVAAGFTPGEADQLRRAMGAWRRTGVIDQFREKLMRGMAERGLSKKFAEQVYNQIRGFGEYGFPESHAASFALLVYVSAWLKHYYPAAFCAALINSQPMGFYAPAQLVRDARTHGVEVLPPDVNASEWDCTLDSCPLPSLRMGEGSRVGVIELRDCAATTSGRTIGELPASHATSSGAPVTPTLTLPHPEGGNNKKRGAALRLGLRMIVGLPQSAAEQITAARRKGPFTSVADVTRRTQLSKAIIERLAAADALQLLEPSRRAALWQALGQDDRAVDHPLFANQEQDDPPPQTLSPLTQQEEVFADYRTAGLSLRAHPISFYREQLTELGAVAAERLGQWEHNTPVCVAGLVLMRQRPSTARGITFITLEDETGVANLVVRVQIWERFYEVARRASSMIVDGILERKGQVIHVVAGRLRDLAKELRRLDSLQTKSRDFR